MHPSQASLDLGLSDAILDQRVQPNLDSFASIAFEEASRDFMGRLARNSRLPFTLERIGSWWEQDAEIDVLALNRVEGHALVGEGKWSVNPVGVDVLDGLKRQAK